MSGFYPINEPSEWRSSHLHGGVATWGPPTLRCFDNVDADEVEAAVNRKLVDPAMQVLAVSPVAAVTGSHEDDPGFRIPRFYASVLYQERLLPNGPEGGEE